MKLIHSKSKQLLADNITVAKDIFSRFKGLLGTDELSPGRGIWLTPCNAVHTFGMRYAIDVLFLDRSLRIVHQVKKLQPNRITRIILKAHSIVELPAGTLEEHPVSRRDQMHILR